MVEKGEKAAGISVSSFYQHFLFFHDFFKGFQKSCTLKNGSLALKCQQQSYLIMVLHLLLLFFYQLFLLQLKNNYNHLKDTENRLVKGTCSFNPFPHNGTFRRLWERSLLKTLWEK